jgi:hypothetical protein
LGLLVGVVISPHTFRGLGFAVQVVGNRLELYTLEIRGTLCELQLWECLAIIRRQFLLTTVHIVVTL